MSAMVRDLKAIGQEVSEEEYVLNVIRVLHKSFKVIMTHSEHIMTFEQSLRKIYAPPSMAFVIKGLSPEEEPLLW